MKIRKKNPVRMPSYVLQMTSVNKIVPHPRHRSGRGRTMKRFLGFLLAFSLLASLASALERGRCPDPEVGICTPDCVDDDDCPDGLLCCINGCGYLRCTEPEPTCEDVDCPEEEQCVMAHTLCGLPLGECPDRPLCIPDDALTCDNVDCLPGYTCIMQEVVCITTPCYPRPFCVPE
ncbi:unnamed protein product [Darwinula stevensoni]|uniref:WAP domain-containing protein n=1 Tax=Darwinula stevensoni TaxID=69355 RepID=A0A7R8X733_9CRUS|nr:unnamed protein product [Darwinula stevensoni]CAG0888674.1 unnamed protein product [Darwinula stevensoni]